MTVTLQNMLVGAFPMALVWILITGQPSITGFLVGYILSLGILLLLGLRAKSPINLTRQPQQIIALIVYTLQLFNDIFWSSIDVTRRVLSPNPRLNMGIVAQPVYADDDMLAALSAHAITITPGQLVVNFEGSHTLYIHCLDVEQALSLLETQQRQRLSLLRRILGKSE